MPRGRPRSPVLLGTVAAALLLAPIVSAAVSAMSAVPAIPGVGLAAQTLTQEEALRTAFPEPIRVERRTAFLTDREIERARELAGPDTPVERSIVTHYVGHRDGVPLGVAYFDAHRVRTLPEVIMIVVIPDGVVESIEVLKFSEPPEYRAPDRWLEQLHGRELGEELSRGGEIVNLTGATLTADAITRATRRVLALHRVIDPLDGANR